MRLKSNESHRKVMPSYSSALSNTYNIKKKWKNQLQLFMAPSESVNNLPKRHTMKQTKLPQLDKVSCKWFTAMCSSRKPRTEHMIIERTKYYYDEIIITDM